MIYLKLIFALQCILLSFSIVIYVYMPDNLLIWNGILIVNFMVAIGASFSGYILNYFQLYLLYLFIFNISLPMLVFFGFYEFPMANNIMESDGIQFQVLDSDLAKTYAALSF